MLSWVILILAALFTNNGWFLFFMIIAFIVDEWN